jgi:dTDP-4-dehydrorhamnose 3,5-epimerase-like enzyme
MIDGVETKDLVTHRDDRGLFRELIRGSDPIFEEGFAQWSHTMSY